MKKKLILLLVFCLILSSVSVFASSQNTVDSYPHVKSDYEFVPTGAFSYLRIEEKSAFEFGPDPQYFTLELDGAEWFEAGEAGSVNIMEADTLSNFSDGITIDRISSKRLGVYIDRANTNISEEAYWRIPLYCKVTGEGDLKVIVDGRDSTISSETLSFAFVPGSNYVPVGYKFDQSNKSWLTIKEPIANAFGNEDKVFRLELSISNWFDESNTRLSPQDMLEDSIMSGVEYAEIKSIERISDKIIEVTVNRGEKSSKNGQAVWSIPIYHIVTEAGTATVNVNSFDTLFEERPLTLNPVKEMVVIDPTIVRVQIGNPILKLIKENTVSETALDAAPYNPSGNTLVPLRGILEGLGAEVLWHEETRKVEIKRNSLNVMFQIGSETAIVNGQEIEMTEAAKIINDRTMIPLRFVSENLGFIVDWNSETEEIDIYED